MQVLALALPLDALAFHQFLHAVECLSRHQRFMRAAMHLSEPPEVADVDRILQEAMQFGFGHLAVAARVAKTDLVGFDGDCL